MTERNAWDDGTAVAGVRTLVNLGSDPSDIRAAGWAVACHNDYRQDGEPRTFWLFTRGTACIKGEGPSDAYALNQVRAALNLPLLRREPPDGVIGGMAIPAEPADAHPNVRRFLEVSTANLSPDMRAKLYNFEGLPGLIGEWSPAGGAPLFGLPSPESIDPSDAPPPALANILAKARRLGCSYILFGDEAPALPGFPIFDDPAEYQEWTVRLRNGPASADDDDFEDKGSLLLSSFLAINADSIDDAERETILNILSAVGGRYVSGWSITREE